MKTFIRDWRSEPPALQDFMGPAFILAFIGAVVFKGPVVDGIFVLCVIGLIATDRSRERMTPFRWVLSTAIVVATFVDYVVETPVTHTAWRTVMSVLAIWFIANRPHIRQYWRDADPSDSRL